MTGVTLCLRKGKSEETTLDNTWRAIGLIGSKSLEIGADSTCENQRCLQLSLQPSTPACNPSPSADII
jgi:hypothetical protein